MVMVQENVAVMLKENVGDWGWWCCKRRWVIGDGGVARECG